MTVRKEVLLLGRETQSLHTLGRQVIDAGWRIRVMAGLEESKSLIAAQQVGLVIIMLDTLHEPLAVIREITFLYRGLPVLAATSRATVHEARESIDQGAADYLMLPIDPPLLRTMLQRYTDQYFDPELGRGRRLLSGDAEMQRILTQVRRVARSKATVLIHGESGTGKELIARYLHQVSDRSAAPFVAINCAALPENLLESELFGHVKGAFTGATADRKGKFLQANEGTILLDEISEMSLNLQAKLLRVLQEGEVDPVGGRGAVTLDVRVLASTNRNLKAWAAEGKFREDLFYRLNVFPIRLPPLRERPADILMLAEHFRVRFIGELGRNDLPFARDALAVLQRYGWPGNIRELENVIHRALLVADGREITAVDLMLDGAALSDGPVTTASLAMPASGAAIQDNADTIRLSVGTTVRQMEEILIRRTLDEVDGNRTRAAEILGISIRTLRNKLNEYAHRDGD
ncbi:MAG: sigma-54-dependent Fis family transcriptional regulator [Magnetococcales bacterium]|nr:sigma-54-dependent Fis family transcriptional regulator [Magnetococcales bacterium]